MCCRGGPRASPPQTPSLISTKLLRWLMARHAAHALLSATKRVCAYGVLALLLQCFYYYFSEQPTALFFFRFGYGVCVRCLCAPLKLVLVRVPRWMSVVRNSPSSAVSRGRHTGISMKRVLTCLLFTAAATGGMAFQLMASRSSSRAPTQMKASQSESFSRRALLEKARCARSERAHVLRYSYSLCAWGNETRMCLP